MPRRPGQPRREQRLPGLPRRSTPDIAINRVRCLKCSEDFPSNDPRINRICPECSDGNQKLSKREVTRPISLPPGIVLPPDGPEFY